MMSLRYAILGLLSHKPMTGYELTKKFDTAISFSWQAKHSQIYPELAALSTEGLVTFELVTQTSKPNKKIYTITEKGLQEMENWIGASAEKRQVKDPLLIKTWSTGITAPQLLLPQLRLELEEKKKQMGLLAFHEENLRAEGADVPGSPAFGRYMSLVCGKLQNEAYQGWLTWAIEQVEALAPKETAAV